MGEGRVIRQAYRFEIAPTPHQERMLVSFTGASRFFFNWGLALVKERLDGRAAGEDVRVPWSYKALCSEFAKVKDDVAPWRREVVIGCQQTGFEQLGRALEDFSRGRKAGRSVGFPRFRSKGRGKEVVFSQATRPVDARHVHFPKLGRIRSKERLTKLIRLLAEDENARILRGTISRQGCSWFVSFQVERSPKHRRARRPEAVVAVDLGLTPLATFSTGDRAPNSRPLRTALRRMRRLQRQLDRQRRAANPGNFLPDGRFKPGVKDWRRSRRMHRTENRCRRLHERVRNLRREQSLGRRESRRTSPPPERRRKTRAEGR